MEKTWNDWFDKWNIKSLKIKSPLLDMELVFSDGDRIAAWQMYIELLTRITTQPLPAGYGDEKTALDSVYSVFAMTRGVLKENGKNCINFARIAILVLNQVIRPFTARWHKRSVDGDFSNPKNCDEFRSDLEDLQEQLKVYVKMLARMAEVDDLSDNQYLTEILF